MKYLFANWKMYLNHAETLELAQEICAKPYQTERLSIAVFPTMLSAAAVVSIAENSPYQVGAQNCAWVPQGAYTGAVSAVLLKDAGCTYVLIGHSERRHVFGESDTDVKKKFEAALGAGLVPVLCIGETQADKEDGKSQYRLKKQIMKVLEGLDLKGRTFIIAYEPVWAISANRTGLICTPADADDVHGWIRDEIREYTDEIVPILYGGSVDATNVLSYLSYPTIDGVLVGNASRKFDTFAALIDTIGHSEF